jgi:hypothetical protein
MLLEVEVRPTALFEKTLVEKARPDTAPLGSCSFSNGNWRFNAIAFEKRL